MGCDPPSLGKDDGVSPDPALRHGPIVVYDVEIRGAGPAGSYAANALARKGYSVHLVDRADFPRDKLCGGGLTRRSLDLIEGLEPSIRSTGLAEFVRDLYLISPDTKESRRFPLPANSLALVRRCSFDAWWLGRARDAGAEFAAPARSFGRTPSQPVGGGFSRPVLRDAAPPPGAQGPEVLRSDPARPCGRVAGSRGLMCVQGGWPDRIDSLPPEEGVER